MGDLQRSFLVNMAPSKGREEGRNGTKAFSLCEVVIAIGLFVFALSSLLGFMPTALHVVRESLDTAVATQLADEVAAGLNRKVLSSPDTLSHYFDDAGKRVSTGTNAFYSVVVAVEDSESASLKRAKITVSRGSEKGPSKTFCYLVFQSPTLTR